MTSLIDRTDFGPDGLRARPTVPPSARLDDVTVRLRVDPVRQTWVALTLDGDDDSPYKTMLLVDGEQASYRETGDPEPIDIGTRSPVPGGLLVSTALIPLALTRGRDSVEITLRTFVHSYRTAADVTGFELADSPSRRYLALETHTAAVPDPLPPVPSHVPPAAAHDVRAEQERAREMAPLLRGRQRRLRERILDRARGGDLPEIGRYREQLRFLVRTAADPAHDGAADAREVVDVLVRCLDAHARAWAEDVRVLASGGHQSDWGGYFAALGEALYLAEPLLTDDRVLGPAAFHALLEEPLRLVQGTGEHALPIARTVSERPTRRQVWEQMLGASFDFARSRLSYIFNQVLYTYEGAWKAHEGLRVIGSARYEGRARSHRILREAWGIAPFLGEEILVGPDGEALDLHHSLFRHDRNVELTPDVLRIVLTGRARSLLDDDGGVRRRRPYGSVYRGVTEAGLPRENSYVGIYGEAMNYLPDWIDRLARHPEDASLREDLVRLALRNVEARSHLRTGGRDANGRAVQRMEQVIDDRNPALPGEIAYVTRASSGTTLSWVGLARDVLDPDGAFAGARWTPERHRAHGVLGRARQELEEGHLLDAFEDVDSTHPAEQHDYLLMSDPRLSAQLAALLEIDEHAARALPAGDFCDVDALIAVRHEEGRSLFVNLCSRNQGFSGTGRFHLVTEGLHVIGTLAVHGELTASEVVLRGGTGESWRQQGPDVVGEGRDFAWYEHLQPVTHQPGVGLIRRENKNEDNPYSACPDLVWARCADVLVAANTTSSAHGNARGLALPVGATVLAPREMRILPLPEPRAGAAPDPVRAVIRTDTRSMTGVSWSHASGASAYEVVGARSGRVLHPGVRGSAALLPGPIEEPLRIDAVSSTGARTRSSMRTPARAELPDPAPDGVLIGTASGRIDRCPSGSVRFDIHGGGLADGDDSRLDQRHRPDALGFAPEPALGAFELTGRILGAEDPTGLMVRDSLAPVARCLLVLVDAQGGLRVRSRDTDTREDFGIGSPGLDARGGIVRSPRWVETGFGSQDAPVVAVRLVRPQVRRAIVVLARTAGGPWQEVVRVHVPLPEIALIGAVSLGSGEVGIA